MDNQEPQEQPTNVQPVGAPPESTPTDRNNTNLLIVVVLAVIVVVLALMYLWGSATSELPPAPPDISDSVVVEPRDEVTALEEDLMMPELDTLDAELDTLEADLDAELQAL